MSTTTPIPSSEYDAGLVNALLDEEIRAFTSVLSEPTLSKEQELRGGLISWFCYLVPELISPEISKRLRDAYETNRTSYFERWYQLLPLEMALFGLTRDQAWLANHKRNLAYGGSSLRYYVIQSLALAVPDLHFDDYDLYDPIRRGLTIPYFGAEMAAAMLAMCKGECGHKRSVLAEWHDSLFLNRPDILKNLAEGKQAENWFFLGHFFDIQAYVIHRLCSKRALSPSKNSSAFLFVGSLIEQIDQHPMMQRFLQIPDTPSAGGATTG